MAVGSAPFGCGGQSGAVDPTDRAGQVENTAVATAAYSTQWVANMIWNDEFSGSALDRTKWVVSDDKYDHANNSGSCFNNEAQAYIDNEGCGAGTSTLCEYNDYLHLIARYYPNAPNGCGHTTNYVSARLTTKTKFDMNPGMGNHGLRIEARINFPQIVTGSWPAFWMLGSDARQWPNPGSVYWPQSGEMDIAEWGSAWSTSQEISTIHYASALPVTYDGQNHAQLGSFWSPAINSTDFHVYGLEWTPSSIAFFLDGNQYGPTSGPPTGDFQNNFAIILNFAMGGPGGQGAGIDPSAVPQSTSSAGAGFDSRQRMAVDWVRVSRLDDLGGMMPRMLQSGTSDAAFPQEWDHDYYKADCGSQAVVNGLSANSASQPHQVLCINGNAGEFTGNGVTTLSDISTAEHRRANRLGDWDYGYYKSECGVNEYVSGISQHPGAARLHGIRCASGSYMNNGGQNNCQTRLIGQDTSNWEWDYGYYKSQCSNGQIMEGVSSSPSSGLPHAILCCDQ
jgi:beta-glucanase (GH16 family)